MKSKYAFDKVSKTQARRLYKLATVVERTHPQHFDMSTELQGGGDAFTTAYKTEEWEECRSAACALGHAPIAFPLDYKYTHFGVYNVGGSSHRFFGTMDPFYGDAYIRGCDQLPVKWARLVRAELARQGHMDPYA